MTRPTRERGSALLLATIIVLMALGIGGAFLAEYVIRQKVQASATRADEALVMCDATLEKARRALHEYRFKKLWAWNDIFTYCSQAQLTTMQQIRDDYLARALTSQFATYKTGYYGNQTGVNTANETPLPSNPQVPNPNDGAASGVLFGWNTPLANGAIHVLVYNNADDPGGALVDTDGKAVLVITATLRDGTQRRIQATVQYQVQPLKANGLAAIVTNSNTNFNGNITVDGRDHDLNGNLIAGVPGTGVPGVISSATVTSGGSSGIGGSGLAPPGKGVAPNTVYSTYPFPNGYPSPDGVLSAKDGTLKALAQANGTYFTSQTDYANYLSLNGGNIPGGQIIYLEATTSPPFELGGTMNTDPSVVVVHNSTSTATIKNVHGEFKGLLLADNIDHVNAGTDILGMIQTFSGTTYGNAFGNGNSTVNFSSAVLQHLPSLDPGACSVLDWKKVLQ